MDELHGDVLNSLLASAKQQYQELRSLFIERTFSDFRDLSDATQRRALALSYNLLRIVERVEAILTAYVLDGRPRSAAAAALQFFKAEISPHEDELRTLLLDLLDLPDMEVNPAELRSATSTPIWNIFQTGIDFHAGNQGQERPNDDFRAAESIIASPFFNPDDWYRNARELQPILGEHAEKRIPINVRGRLSELYWSFILANYMAAIALARSILEYSLVDRASRLGIEPYATDRDGKRRTKRISVLVGIASERLPELSVRMEEIVECANQILHPTRNDKLLLAPSALRAQALRCVNSAREIAVALYL